MKNGTTHVSLNSIVLKNSLMEKMGKLAPEASTLEKNYLIRKTVKLRQDQRQSAEEPGHSLTPGVREELKLPPSRTTINLLSKAILLASVRGKSALKRITDLSRIHE